MNKQIENGNSGFMTGLIVGGVIGAGLALAFAPRLAAELRERVMGSAADLKNAASDGYRNVTTRIVGVVDGATAKGQTMRDDMAEAVGRGAREVERGAREVEQFAMASKTRS